MQKPETQIAPAKISLDVFEGKILVEVAAKPGVIELTEEEGGELLVRLYDHFSGEVTEKRKSKGAA